MSCRIFFSWQLIIGRERGNDEGDDIPNLTLSTHPGQGGFDGGGVVGDSGLGGGSVVGGGGGVGYVVELVLLVLEVVVVEVAALLIVRSVRVPDLQRPAASCTSSLAPPP